MKKAKFSLGLPVVFLTEKQTTAFKGKKPFMSKGTIAGIGCDDEGYVYEVHSMGDKTMVKEENICVESQSQGMREKFEELCFPPNQEPAPEA